MKIKMYFVTKNLPKLDECLDHLYTVVKNEKQAREYIDRNIYQQHYVHFSAWCEFRNKDVDDINNFYEYIKTRYKDCDESPYDDFKIIKLKYSKDALLSIIRTLSGCVPVNASYETDEEIQIFLNSVNESKEAK